MGTTKNASSTRASGRICSATLTRADTIAPLQAPSGAAAGRDCAPRPLLVSGGFELVPALAHILVLVHHRIPAGDVGEAVDDRAAVARGAGLFHDHAIGILDLFDRRLAVVPVAVFIGGHELGGRLRHRAVIAVARDERALPAGVVPV